MTAGLTISPRFARPGAAPRPLDGAALEALAIRYVGRYATTRAKLEAYLQRKIDERGWEDGAAPDLPALVGRIAALGYVDDRAFAAARAGALARRGYGGRRIGAALHAAGIDEADRPVAGETASRDALAAALVLARRKRIGPFAAEPHDREARRRAIAALMRAGHDLALARRIVATPPGEEVPVD